MLTLYRSNRIDLLAQVLAQQLQLEPPDPFEQVAVLVNTWPTSRWLGEQLALHLGGVVAQVRYPFPGAHLRQLVDTLLAEGPTPLPESDPWRANRLVWPLLVELPAIRNGPHGEPLRRWQALRAASSQSNAQPGPLDLAGWQLARAIADAFDDYGLYRPDMVRAWLDGHDQAADGQPLEPQQRWQPALLRALHQRLGVDPFGLRVDTAITALRQAPPPPGRLPARLRLFGLSSLAPVQVRLLQALSGHLPVDVFLLTPCPDLWQRLQERRSQRSAAGALVDPLDAHWLLTAPGLEARFGRLGAEFHQLLEGCGEAQLGVSREGDLFLLPATIAQQRCPQRPPPLLAQLQQELVGGEAPLQLAPGDTSLQFLPCAGALRQLEVVRDRLLQLLAADATLQPRDILVMTPQVDQLAPLLPAVFGDGAATGVDLPWRLTDRSQQSEAGIASALLQLLRLGGERLTASGLDGLLASRPLQQRFELEPHHLLELQRALQQGGFRWGLDGRDRGGSANHSLRWIIDRLLLGLVLPAEAGLAPADTAPLPLGDLELCGRWLHLLLRLQHWLARLGRPRSCPAWADLLRQLVADLFGEGGEASWELPPLLAAIHEWQIDASGCALELEAPVVAALLDERLAVDSGRFGHRSGALTISALEPMRAIPHRVIVLLGLDGDLFPRQAQRPAFHALEQQRRLGDPNPADQDRYALLEALLSARDHLLISWSCRAERSGEELQPAGPVRQWLDWLEGRVEGASARLTLVTPASPLERTNFVAGADGRPPLSCDRRLLEARRRLDAGAEPPPAGLIATTMPAAAPGPPAEPVAEAERLRDWLRTPQRQWLRELGLRPREREHRLDDLEALEGDERLRSRVFRDGLAHWPDPTTASPLQQPEGWLALCRGRGLLPPLAAAELEARRLAERWCSLATSLEQLGPAIPFEAAWGPWRLPLQRRGDAVVLLHTARARVAERLELWLLLLLAAAAGQAPARGLVLARHEDRFSPVIHLAAPQPEQAQAELDRLGRLEHHWRHRCWPAPPATAWSWLEAERKKPGSGQAKALQAWEGGWQTAGERDQEEMVVCFGSGCAFTDLLAGGLVERADELYGPLLEACR
ncbi:MAG: exodeoxyribonuclease V subunit gamma [Cyanobacteriota bacterium]|nr:exodeoxyribonuclease V subunit gamma [Cyanobacteriota bacterium]